MNKKKQAVIITGGRGPGKKCACQAVKKANTIIAADSGFDLCLEYGITPDWIVGDMDSLKNKKMLSRFPTERILTFSTEKDETDTEIALKVLYEQGYDDITVVGGDGGRIDHFMGILYLFYREIRPKVWLCESEMVISIESRVRVSGETGCIVSFFPGSDELCTMISSGLKWELDGLSWNIGDCGISNEILDSTFTVTPLTGRLLMVASLREGLHIER